MSWGSNYTDCDISVLIGKTLTEIARNGDDELTFTTDSGEVYKMYHQQDCCEDVNIEDIYGDLDCLVGTPILKAEVATNSDNPKNEYDSFTWTFYHLATIKGYVTIRWYGGSNGYYSESVDFALFKETNI